MNKKIKLGGVFALTALVGYTVYTKVKEHIQQKQEEEIIDITPQPEENSQK